MHDTTAGSMKRTSPLPGKTSCSRNLLLAVFIFYFVGGMRVYSWMRGAEEKEEVTYTRTRETKEWGMRANGSGFSVRCQATLLGMQTS